MTITSTQDPRCRLDAACALSDNRFHAAAIGLLDFAGLLDRREVRRYIQTHTVPDDENQDVEAAWVDWAGIAAAGEEIGPLYGGQDRLLRLALSIAHGTPVDLEPHCPGSATHTPARSWTRWCPRWTCPATSRIAAYLERKGEHDDALQAILASRGLNPDDYTATSEPRG
ncbi:hypothetical protein [Nocardia sp. CY41]|uniref:hypothetical protein n=1 Tax=Nocardia sp. CY41 TaxID=2608686 RepID=UPI0013580268|nr:hypothetical protein [Nocardia sp. CY41]